jgi:hypothetical protein
MSGKRRRHADGFHASASDVAGTDVSAPKTICRKDVSADAVAVARLRFLPRHEQRKKSMHSRRRIDVARRFRIRPLSACLAAIVAWNAAAGEPERSESAFLFDFADAFYPLRPSIPTPDFVAAIQRSRAALAPAQSEGQPAIKSVLNCDDAGAGSLREAVTNAASGDMIFLTALMGCSEISLSTGEIHVAVADLTLQGPGAGQLSIKGGASASHFNRIFKHTGVGTLSIADLTLTDAHYQGQLAKGGCVYSAGSTDVKNSVVSGCVAEAPAGSNAYAIGGALYGREDVTLTNSALTGNIAMSAENQALGGSVFVRGNFSATDSTIANSLAIAPQSYSGGGGIAQLGAGDFDLVGSTLFGNAADDEGGIYVITTGTSTVKNSTISQNYASGYVAGAGFNTVTISNSTVTRNVAGFSGYGAGVYVAYALTAQSSIFSNNIGAGDATELDVFAGSIDGGENAIGVANTAVPAATVRACPFLSPLQDNGGPTLTHRLMKGSPGIDVGNNLAGLMTDQRWTGFERDFGMHVDIGAVEWRGEADDEIFKTEFETLCD